MTTTTLKRSMKDKMVDAMRGVGIGDSYTLGFEMKSRNWILANVVFSEEKGFINVWNEGKNNIAPGDYSDDTEHTIGIAEALLEDSKLFNADLIIEKCKNEYEADMARKGHARDGHGSIEAWYLGKKTIEEVRASQASREDPGNAPVMRALPIAFTVSLNNNVGLTLLKRHALENANATHPHDHARMASMLTILICHYFLVLDGAPDGLVHFLIKFLETLQCVYVGGEVFNNVELKRQIIDQLNRVDELPAPNAEFLLPTLDDYIVLHGVQPLPRIPNLPAHYFYDPNVFGLPCSALKTVWSIVYILKHIQDPFDALKACARMGGDVDSLAAICVGVTAGQKGLSTIPSFILDKTEGSERLKQVGERLYERYGALCEASNLHSTLSVKLIKDIF